MQRCRNCSGGSRPAPRAFPNLEDDSEDDEWDEDEWEEDEWEEDEWEEDDWEEDNRSEEKAESSDEDWDDEQDEDWEEHDVVEPGREDRGEEETGDVRHTHDMRGSVADPLAPDLERDEGEPTFWDGDEDQLGGELEDSATWEDNSDDEDQISRLSALLRNRVPSGLQAGSGKRPFPAEQRRLSADKETEQDEMKREGDDAVGARSTKAPSRQNTGTADDSVTAPSDNNDSVQSGNCTSDHVVPLMNWRNDAHTAMGKTCTEVPSAEELPKDSSESINAAGDCPHGELPETSKPDAKK